MWVPGTMPVVHANIGRPARYPWMDLRRGDFFTVPCKNYKDGLRLQRSLSGTAGKKFGKGGSASRFDREKMTITIWRLR